MNSAPEIFQRIFEGLLSSCQNCINYLDDIIIFGETETEHDNHLAKVLSVLRQNNVELNKTKCLARVEQLKFLGHKLSAKGIEADDDKIKTVRGFRPPTTKEEIRIFLGLVTYLRRFIPGNHHGTTAPPNKTRRTIFVVVTTPKMLRPTKTVTNQIASSFVF